MNKNKTIGKIRKRVLFSHLSLNTALPNLTLRHYIMHPIIRRSRA